MIIRAACADDASEVANVMNEVIDEGRFTLFDRRFSAAEERSFLESLGTRSKLFVAQDSSGIVGVQSMDLYSSLSASMRHVATMGTWLKSSVRGQGLGKRLALESLRFAASCDYKKIVIQVLAGNERALRFYSRLGFERIGVARAQVCLDGVYHDEVFMEKHL